MNNLYNDLELLTWYDHFLTPGVHTLSNALFEHDKNMIKFVLKSLPESFGIWFLGTEQLDIKNVKAFTPVDFSNNFPADLLSCRLLLIHSKNLQQFFIEELKNRLISRGAHREMAIIIS